MIEVLGVEVSADRLDAWASWLAPDPQPFVVGADSEWTDLGGTTGVLPPEVRDTFRIWAAPKSSRLVWLTSERFHSLPGEVRGSLVREQVHRRNGKRPGVGAVPSVRAWADLIDPAILRREADGHRFVWWPDLVAIDPAEILRRLVSTDRLASRHLEVTMSTWAACERVLPVARDLAGTWTPLDAPGCCFSTVLEAAGAEATAACDNTEVFDRWLRSACRKGGDSTRPGTVLVWREGGSPVHAAVSIGDGWALEKPSQEWHSPRAIALVDDVVRTARTPGQRLERHTIVT